MTEIIQDFVDVDLQIGTGRDGIVDVIGGSFEDDALFWNVIEMEVELTQAASPNYVKGKVSPKPEYTDTLDEILSTGTSPADTSDSNVLPNNGISKLVGSHFRLEVDNEFVTVQSDQTTNKIRQTSDSVSDVDEDRLLFNGRLANISPIGTNLYEIIAYDPGQQAFNIGAESGSIINQKLDFTGNSISFRDPEDEVDNNITGDTSETAIDIVESVVDAAGLSSRTKILTEDFKADTGSAAVPADQFIRVDFKKLVVPVKEALNRVRELTNTEWWFGKNGVFYFGDPGNDALGDSGSQVYETRLITDTSAGITTPPYQSVRVIGRGVASTEGWTGNASIQDENDALVVTANIAQPDAGGQQAETIIQLDPISLQEPTFKYINAEIATDKQAQNTALKIANELIKQQASGTVTVVGMAEVEPFDGILMPNTEAQPMGGQLYDVYAVRHRLNASDGFVTEIEVAGPNPRIRAEADVGEESEDIIATSIDRDVYTPDGERRAFGSGAGRSSEVGDTSGTS